MILFLSFVVSRFTSINAIRLIIEGIDINFHFEPMAEDNNKRFKLVDNIKFRFFHVSSNVYFF